MKKKILLIICIFSCFSNCTNINTMASDKQNIKQDMTNYLQGLHGESFQIKSVKNMANAANPGMRNLYELICFPTENPHMVFDARVGYNKNNNFFVAFEYYQTVRLSLQGNDYAQDIIRKYYPNFVTYTNLSGIQRILDEMPPFDLPTYHNFVVNYAKDLNTHLFIAIPKNAANEGTHKENLRNIFRDYKKKGHLNLTVNFGFYTDDAKSLMSSKPNSFFDTGAPPARKFQHKETLIKTWTMDLTKGIMSDSEKYLTNLDKFMRIREK